MEPNKKGWLASWKARATSIKQETIALFLAYRHPLTPWYAKVVAGIVVAYAFSPIDLIPDFIPVLGYLDDLGLVPLGISLTLKLIPQAVLVECRIEAQLHLNDDKPINWFAAALVILVWLVTAMIGFHWMINILRSVF